MIRKIFVIICFIFFIYKIQVSADAGNYLKLEPSARIAALGNAGAGDLYSYSANYVNPAALKIDTGYLFLFAYNNWLENAKLSFVSIGVYPFIKKNSALIFSYYSMAIDGIERRYLDTSDFLNILPVAGEVEASSANYGLTYIRRGFDKRFNWAARLHNTNIKLDRYSDNAQAIDFGAAFRWTDEFRVGAVIKNLFGTVSMTGAEKEKLFREYRLGASYLADYFNLKINGDIVKYSDRDLAVQAGIEYNLNKKLFLRVGYNSNLEDKMRLSYGIGIAARKMNIDFAFLPMDILGNTWRVSGHLNFDKKHKQQDSDSAIIKTEAVADIVYIAAQTQLPSDTKQAVEAEEVFLTPKVTIKSVSDNLITIGNIDGFVNSPDFKPENIIEILRNSPEFTAAFKKTLIDKFYKHRINDWDNDKNIIIDKWREFENSSVTQNVYYLNNFTERTIVDYQNNFFEYAVLLDSEMDKSDETLIKEQLEKIKKYFDEPDNAAVKEQLANSDFESFENKFSSRVFFKNVEIYKEGDCIFTRLKLKRNNCDLRAEKFKPLIDKYAQVFDIEPEFISSIIKIESSFNPDAVGPSKEKGLMQLRYQTAGYDVTKELFGAPEYVGDELFDPELNIFFGAAYLNIIKYKYLKRFNDKLTDEQMKLFMVTAYNAGIKYVYDFAGSNDITVMSDSEFKTKLLKAIPQTTRDYIRKMRLN